MILQALVEFYESMAARGEMPPFGWMQVPVSYILDIDREGNLIRANHTMSEVTMGKKMLREVAESKRVSSIEKHAMSSWIKDVSFFLLRLIVPLRVLVLPLIVWSHG